MDHLELEEKLTKLDKLQSLCTGCGVCSEACATFLSSGWEHESPRGRLLLASQFLHGRIHPESKALSTFDRCLGCQACQPLCPHQVPYHQIRELVQEVRRGIKSTISSLTMKRRQYQQWIQKAYRIAYASRRRYWGRWMALSFFKFRRLKNFRIKQSILVAEKPVLAICCVQDLFQHEVIEQALGFIERLGYSFQIDRKQPCCGALFERLVHGGEESICYPKEQQKASAFQRETVESFLHWLPSQTYFLSKGCECFVRRHHFSPLDLYDWILNRLDQQQLILYFPIPRQVYYQPYCVSEGQAKDSIRRLLQRIKGLTVFDIFYSQACCGGYCGESVLHPQEARALLEQKISQLPEGATLIVTSPDCWEAFHRYAVHRHVTILYPIQLLAQAHDPRG